MRRTALLLLSLLLIGLISLSLPAGRQVISRYISSPTPTPLVITFPSVLGTRTKTEGCRVQEKFPDPDCTPGAVISNVTRDMVCTSGYSASVRNVPEGIKRQIYAAYGISTHFTGEYEVDHLISLELGGSNDISNLWPEAREPRPGYREKDQVENYLHKQVCEDKMTLKDAQEIISANWLSVRIEH